MGLHYSGLTRKQIISLSAMFLIEVGAFCWFYGTRDFSFIFGWFTACAWLATRRKIKTSEYRFLWMGITAVVISGVTRSWLIPVGFSKWLALCITFGVLLLVELDNAALVSRKENSLGSAAEDGR